MTVSFIYLRRSASFLSITTLAQRLEAAKRKKATKDDDGDEDISPDGGGVVDRGDGGQDDDEDLEEARKAAEFFEDGDGDDLSPGEEGEGGLPFQRLNLSRPLLRAVEAMGFVSPTPIQQRAVPLALAGR